MNRSDRLDRIFFALSDPTRRALMARLTAGATSVLELARPFRMTQPAITKHLRVLEAAGLVSQSKLARQRPRRLEAVALAEVEEWLEPWRKYIRAAIKKGAAHG
ncbi:MAG: metalloregulator ArsR/SmtB family transcription factor [Candidatus Eisenbacteria bacterium]